MDEFKKPGNCHFEAWKAIHDASIAAIEGRHEDARKLLDQADQHAKNHQKVLEEMKEHAEHKVKFTESFGKFRSDLSEMLPPIHEVNKSEKLEKIYTTNSPTGNKAASPARRDYNAGKLDDKIKLNNSPGYNKNYNYKHFDELSEYEQHQVSLKFRDSKENHSQYHYPFDKKTGELAHATRWKAPPAPKADAQPARAGATAQGTRPPQATEPHPKVPGAEPAKVQKSDSDEKVLLLSKSKAALSRLKKRIKRS